MKILESMQKLTNHIILVSDRFLRWSISLSNTSTTFLDLVPIEPDLSTELDQETRVSIYLFDDTIKCIVFDMDVMRVKSLAGLYNIGGQTALMDATGLAIEEAKHIPELHSDHAFLVYVLTDGMENASRRYTGQDIAKLINGLPDHWTVVAQVPDASGVHEAKKFGFPAGNIQI
jgi:hypothetical protein